MWDLVIHLAIGTLIGVYIGNSVVRHRVNALLVSIFKSISEMINKEMSSNSARTVYKSSPQTAQIKPRMTSEAVSNGRLCHACQKGHLEPVREGIYKGYWFCPSCLTMEATK
jgi:hypothetical protein